MPSPQGLIRGTKEQSYEVMTNDKAISENNIGNRMLRASTNDVW